jgi:hypothetical protein
LLFIEPFNLSKTEYEKRVKSRRRLINQAGDCIRCVVDMGFDKSEEKK